MKKTAVEVEEFYDRDENDEPRITIVEEFEVLLAWNNGEVSFPVIV